MNRADVFRAMGEFFAAGFFENENAAYLERNVRRLVRTLENVPLLPYEGGKLYPSGAGNLWNPENRLLVCFDYSFGMRLDADRLRQKAAELLHGQNADQRFRGNQLLKATEELAFLRESDIPPQFALGGRGWTHGVVHYERLIREGLAGILQRVEENLPQNPEFYGALRELLQAMIAYLKRCLAFLRPLAPEPLIKTLERVPEFGARTFYEAVFAYNFFWYFDGCDSGGRLDAVLDCYRQTESEEEITALCLEMWRNYDLNDGWHVLLDPRSSLCVPAIRAQRDFRRPNSGILIDKHTPQPVWDAIFENWGAGNPSPCLYAKDNYEQYLAETKLFSREDTGQFCFGGCTELMIQGKSNTKSIDAGIHVFRFLETPRLQFADFDAFPAALLANIRRQIALMIRCVKRNRDAAALLLPNPVRTLFFDDCIERGREFNAGGARYYCSVINVVGLTNLINAVYAVKEAFAGKLSVSVSTLAAALAADFQGYESLLHELRNLPKYGNDNPAVDSIAGQMMEEIFSAVAAFSTPKHLFLPAVILFTIYGACGDDIGATPDGRLAGEALADSFGATQGTDLNGPTALLKSAARMNQRRAIGTPVLNLRLTQALFQSAETRTRLQALLNSYFQMGGLQVQPTISNPELLEKARQEPENFPNLIVRIGGFSEYFNRLSPQLQLEVIKRTEHHF